jgi:hypothetical protein
LASGKCIGKECHVVGRIMITRTCSIAWRHIAGSLSGRWCRHDISLVLYFSGWKAVILWLWQRVTYKPCALCQDSSHEWNKCVTVNTLVIKFVPGCWFMELCMLKPFKHSTTAYTTLSHIRTLSYCQQIYLILFIWGSG